MLRGILTCVKVTIRSDYDLFFASGLIVGGEAESDSMSVAERMRSQWYRVRANSEPRSIATRQGDAQKLSNSITLFENHVDIEVSILLKHLLTIC